MQKTYITGSAIISALGNNKEESIAKIKKIDDLNYHSFLEETFADLNFYGIKQKFPSQNDKFYCIIKQIVGDAVLEAGLSSEEAKDLHIFLGSTSMHISINEEANSEFLTNKGKHQIKKIGYGFIGDFIEDLIHSKHKSTIIQSACTSSSNAISYAADLIKNKKIKRALVVGIELFNQSTLEGFKSLMLLSENEQIKPFDRNSDGIILGEASSAIILDSKKAAPNNFEYLSSNSNFDNYSVTTANPNGEITFQCMKGAITRANLKLKDINFLKSHATGSPSSSLSEAVAIDKLFKHYEHKIDVVALKPFIGHTLGASGINEIVLLCQCIKNGFVPKTFGFNQSYNDVAFDVLTKNKNADSATILFNSIGFGGSNHSIILSNKSS